MDFKKLFTLTFIALFAQKVSAIETPLTNQIKNSVTEEITNKILNFIPDTKVSIKFNGISTKYGFSLCQSDLVVTTPPRIYKNFTVRVTCPDNDNKWSLGVTGQTTQMLDVVTTTTHVKRGQELSGKVKKIMKDVSNLRGNFTQDLTQVNQSISARNLQKGKIIKISDLKNIEAVKRKDKVNILYRKNGIKIIYYGVAKESGSIGDYIQVQNPNSNKTISARVTGIKEVSIE